MTPLTAIRKYCLYCSNNQPIEIQKCPSKNCPFYLYRMGKNTTKPRQRALKAIRKYCLDCSNNSSNQVKKCTFSECPLFEYRSGKNPKCVNRKGNSKWVKKSLLWQ